MKILYQKRLKYRLFTVSWNYLTSHLSISLSHFTRTPNFNLESSIEMMNRNPAEACAQLVKFHLQGGSMAKTKVSEP